MINNVIRCATFPFDLINHLYIMLCFLIIINVRLCLYIYSVLTGYSHPTLLLSIILLCLLLMSNKRKKEKKTLTIRLLLSIIPYIADTIRLWSICVAHSFFGLCRPTATARYKNLLHIT